MDKIFPKEIKMFASQSKVKKAFISDTPKTNPNDCDHCGGAEVFALFCGLKGPFQTPAAPNQKEGEMYLVSHWDETAGNKGGWWVGVTYTFPCPVCIGGQKPIEPERTYPTQREMGRLIHPHTKEVFE